MSQREVRSWSPLWLEYSGLPQHLAEKTRGGPAWTVFKKIVELDCDRNTAPGTVEISLLELEQRCGVAPDKIRKLAPALRKLKLLAFFLPDNDEEAALFRVVTPLKTPIDSAAIRAQEPHLFETGGTYFRYVDDFQAETADELPASDPHLKAVVDLYFDVVGLKMNVFILDELRMLPQKFEMDEIRRVFARARKNEIRSLRWVIQELVRQRKKHEDAPKPAETTPFASNGDDQLPF